MPITRKHICLNIAGALKEPAKWRGVITVDDKVLTEIGEIREFFQECLDSGWRFLPFSDECEGFDYQTGCPGHTIPEPVILPSSRPEN